MQACKTPELMLIVALALGTGALAATRAIINMIAPQPTATQTPAASGLAETFALDGPIEQITPTAWVVNGITVALDAQTAVSGTPVSGAMAHVRGVFQENGTLLARSITVDTLPSAQTSVPPVASPQPAPAATQGVPEPTVPPVPTVTPVPEPTSAPAAPAPPPQGDLFAQLRALLVAGAADGRTGEDGKELVKKLDEAQAAFASGDLKKVDEKLRELRQKVQEKTREGKMDSDFARQALAYIDAITTTYTLNVGADGTGGNPGEGDDKKDDKDKGN
jgi:hypothetical protein